MNDILADTTPAWQMPHATHKESCLEPFLHFTLWFMFVHIFSHMFNHPYILLTFTRTNAHATVHSYVCAH